MRTTRILLATLAIVSLAACTAQPTTPWAADADSRLLLSSGTAGDSTSTTSDVERQGGMIGAGN